MVRWDVFPQPALALRVAAPVVGITFVGRFLGNFDTEDLVNCISLGR